MPLYGILLNPSYNRVYFQSTRDLAVSELKAANIRMSQPCLDIMNQTIAGVEYITFQTEQPLREDDVRTLSILSFVYAIFELGSRESGSRQALYPINKNAPQYFEDDIVTILKYPGKTNEAFTRLMINIGWLISDSYNNENISLLDPVCGRGTSLFQGLAYGFNVFGVELDRAAVQQAVTFLTRYLKTKRYKHKLLETKMSEGGKKICEIYKYSLANTKDSYKGGKTLQAEFYRGDTLYIPKFIRKNSIDIIAGDLPYGVQHGSSTHTGSFTRNPESLLREAIPQWVRVMKPGGAMVLSWNTFVIKKEIITEIMETAGLKVQTGDPFDGFVHRVDQAIIRDLIAARK